MGRGSIKSGSIGGGRDSHKILHDKAKLRQEAEAFHLHASRRSLRIEKKIENATVAVSLHGVMDSRYYTGASVFFTVLSLILLAGETDMRAAGQKVGPWITYPSLCGLCFFIFDVLARAYLLRCQFFKGSLNYIDVIVVVADIALFTDDEMPNVVSALKAIRFLRLTRVFVAMSDFRELYLIIVGILCSLRALLFGSLLLFLLLSMFSIFAVNFIRPLAHDLYQQGLYGDCESCASAFDSVTSANLTFMATIVAGDAWRDLLIPLVQSSPMAAFIIMGAYCCVHMGLLNTIAAVLVDRQQQARLDDKHYMHILQSEELLNSLTGLQTIYREFQGQKEDDTATDLNELMKLWQHCAEFRTVMQNMDIHEADLSAVFDILDADNTGDISFAEFVNGLHEMQHANTRTLQVFTKHYAGEILDRWEEVDHIRHTLTSHTKALEEILQSVGSVKKAVIEKPSVFPDDLISPRSSRQGDGCFVVADSMKPPFKGVACNDGEHANNGAITARPKLAALVAPSLKAADLSDARCNGVVLTSSKPTSAPPPLPATRHEDSRVLQENSPIAEQHLSPALLLKGGSAGAAAAAAAEVQGGPGRGQGNGMNGHGQQGETSALLEDPTSGITATFAGDDNNDLFDALKY
eukprot:TRINITY_DN60258_c0_g1_i1.p1 TRINITY_DN60258_c0_g1~~TRINITY_DN60258_c0_g1_i1.p1  ORF type:complete len:636 (-),score=143.80 TRINITY_DN60258_c0_g1_i1:162-2069(-)